MLFLFVLSFVATRHFYRTAKVKGLHPGRAAGIPVIGLMVLFLLNWFLVLWLSFWYFSSVDDLEAVRESWVGTGERFLRSILLGTLYCYYLRRFCNVLERYPDLNSSKK